MSSSTSTNGTAPPDPKASGTGSRNPPTYVGVSLEGINKDRDMSIDSDDDATVQSGNTTYGRKKTTSELTLKLTFRVNPDDGPDQQGKMIRSVLESMLEAFPYDVVIVGNNGQPLSNIHKLTAREVSQNFKINTMNGQSNNKKQKGTYIVFRISTTETLRNLRRNAIVFKALQDNKAFLRIYPWPEDITDTVAVAFFVGAIPRYETEETFSKTLSTLISSKTGRNTKNIPNFRCTMTTVRARLGATPTRCTAFELQVQKPQAGKMIDLLVRTFQGNSEELKIMFYKQRHTHPSTFAKAICAQGSFEANHRIVTVEGVSDEEWFEFELEMLRKFPQIQKTIKAYQSSDRWNLVCKAEDYLSLARAVSRDIGLLYQNYRSERKLENGEMIREPRVVSKTNADDSSYDTTYSRDSFCTDCESVFADVDIDYHMPTSTQKESMQTGRTYAEATKNFQPNPTHQPTSTPAPDDEYNRALETLKRLETQFPHLRQNRDQTLTDDSHQHQPRRQQPNLPPQGRVTTPTDDELHHRLESRVESFTQLIDQKIQTAVTAAIQTAVAAITNQIPAQSPSIPTPNNPTPSPRRKQRRTNDPTEESDTNPSTHRGGDPFTRDDEGEDYHYE
jgi:hypothetical protein